MATRWMAWVLLATMGALPACGGEADEGASDVPLEIVAESPRRWTGVAVSPEGRIFVNWPRWSDDVPVSVAELVDGEPVPFPDAAWNAWETGGDPATGHVCVQSVVFDERGTLWILDPASPSFQGVVPGGAKLSYADPDRGILGTIAFDASVARPDSYLNDVRIDTATDTAYITDSGNGALVVVDLASGTARRLLDEHPATHAEPIEITIEGEAWTRGGETPQVHADGIALSPDRRWLYFQALTGRTMYRVPTAALRDDSLSDEALGAQVEAVAQSGVCDGLLFDERGFLYLSSLEENAVNRLTTPGHERQRVVHDGRLRWPDSFSRGPGGWIYVTTAQIHLGDDVEDPFRLWRFRPTK